MGNCTNAETSKIVERIKSDEMTPEQIKELIREQGLNVTEEELKNLFEERSGGGDNGTLDLEEFTNGIEEQWDGVFTESQLEMFFNAADASGDGSVDYTEFIDAVENFGFTITGTGTPDDNVGANSGDPTGADVGANSGKLNPTGADPIGHFIDEYVACFGLRIGWHGEYIEHNPNQDVEWINKLITRYNDSNTMSCDIHTQKSCTSSTSRQECISINKERIEVEKSFKKFVKNEVATDPDLIPAGTDWVDKMLEELGLGTSTDCQPYPYADVLHLPEDSFAADQADSTQVGGDLANKIMGGTSVTVAPDGGQFMPGGPGAPDGGPGGAGAPDGGQFMPGGPVSPDGGQIMPGGPGGLAIYADIRNGWMVDFCEAVSEAFT